jgi:glyoxylase-like metal-dependent hydrolase (beta-lactamase superfamily II)
VGDTPLYRVYAVRYGEMLGRPAPDILKGADPHEQPFDMDYFVWALVSDERFVVVDTGFNAESARRRGRTMLREPVDGLRLIGIDAATVQDVVITHLHYDHVGSFWRFPAARFHLQDDEIVFATGRDMLDESQSHSFEVDEVCGMVRKVYDKRVVFHDGDEALFPGISLHRIPGHTKGLQSVSVATRRGNVVLASDAAHYYANIERRMVFPIFHDESAVLTGFDRLHELADSPAHVIPGHDPEVMRRYPAPEPALEGIVARLD